jgi:hypothetical protein
VKVLLQVLLLFLPFMVTATATFNSLQAKKLPISTHKILNSPLPSDLQSKAFVNVKAPNGELVKDLTDKSSTMVIASDPIRRTASNPDFVGSHTGIKSIPSQLLSERLSSSTSTLVKAGRNVAHQTQTSKRLYASNSVKVKDIQVESSCFEKIRLLGKGDIGRVFLVRRKDNEKLYAMKGNLSAMHILQHKGLFIKDRCSS